MVDPKDDSEAPLPELDDGNLIGQIDELEALLTEKKAEAQKAILPRLNVGTDGIPILVEIIAEEGLDSDTTKTNVNKNEQIINDIIDKIDKEITKDLDELVLMFKDNIIDEVKTRLLKELKINKDNIIDKNKE